jgi:preprotein translocase subunit SecG
MYVVFIVLTVIVAIMLIGIVLIQKSKGGGLSSQFGGGNQVLGVRGTNSFLEKTTWTLAALIVVFSVGAAYTLPKAGSDTEVRAVATTNQPAAQQANAFATDAAAEKSAQKAPEAPAAEKAAPAPAATEAPAGE